MAAEVSEQLVLGETGAPTPPELKLTRRQRFALELIARVPLSSENLGAALHEYRRDEGGRGHAATATCDFCRGEGAHMGSTLRKKKLVRFAQGLGVWYLDGERRPKAGPDLQTTDIPF